MFGHATYTVTTVTAVANTSVTAVAAVTNTSVTAVTAVTNTSVTAVTSHQYISYRSHQYIKGNPRSVMRAGDGVGCNPPEVLSVVETAKSINLLIQSISSQLA